MLTNTKISISKTTLLYLLLITLVILDRILIYQNFNYRFVGSDDMVFWQGANDYMHGRFYVPYFYGQNYNVMLESVFAIPFLLLNIPYHIAFFISTSILALFPFFIFSLVLWKRNYVIPAFFFLIIPLLLPIEYGIITSISRGFVNGLFFTGFFIFPLLAPEKKNSWIIAALAASLGHVVNPNAMIVTLPIYLYLLAVNFKKLPFYLYSGMIIILVLLIELKAKHFYVLHPENNFNSMPELTFDITRILKSFDHLDTYFSYLTPVIWSAGWISLVIAFILGLRLIKKEWKKGLAIVLGVLFIIVTLGIDKVQNNMPTIFFSSVRMFLGVPIFTGIVFLWTRPLLSKISDKHLKISFVCIAVCTFFIKSSLYRTVVDIHTAKKIDFGAVAINKIKNIQCDCDSIKNISVKHKIDLIVVMPSWDTLSNIPFREFVAYGCPLLVKEFPPTVMNFFEKRSWVYLKEKQSIRKNILFYGGPVDIHLLKKLSTCEIIQDKPSQAVFVIKNNTLRLDSLCKKLDIHF